VISSGNAPTKITRALGNHTSTAMPRLPRDDLFNAPPPDVTRFKAAAAKRVQAHRARARMGLRCLTVRINDRTVRHLISTGYALEACLRG
jgi:hypothetical protein